MIAFCVVTFHQAESPLQVVDYALQQIASRVRLRWKITLYILFNFLYFFRIKKILRSKKNKPQIKTTCTSVTKKLKG